MKSWHFKEDGASMRCGFCDDFLRCCWTKFGSEMRVFHDLLTDLNRSKVLTLSRDRMSGMTSLGIKAGGIGASD
jgi:hypothetical protein